MSFLSRLSFLVLASGVQVFSMGPKLTIITDLDDVQVVNRQRNVFRSNNNMQETRQKSKSFKELSQVEMVQDDEQCTVTHRVIYTSNESFEVFSPREKREDLDVYNSVSPQIKKNQLQRIIASISCRSLPEDL